MGKYTEYSITYTQRKELFLESQILPRSQAAGYCPASILWQLALP